MKSGWRIGALGIPFLLMGCDGQTRTQALAECRMNAAKIYPHWSTDEDITPAADFAYFCMQAKGFELIKIGTAADCPYTSGVALQTSAECYRKKQLWE